MKKERDPELVAIGQRVRAARLSRGMTKEALAEAAETSTQFLSQIEKGEQSMTMMKFKRLCKALGVSSDSCFSAGSTPAEPPPWRRSIWRE